MLVPPAPAQRLTWRTPAVIVACGCLIGMLTFGPRATLGFFLSPLSQANGWGRDVFALALAVQNLLWGLGQPLAGAVADRYGSVRVLAVGTLLYAVGLVLMAYATTPAMLYLSAGVLIGFGLSG
ncbi:MAG TPA: MFS transporter, partial [Xanthobacteraceae bacterium]|nr:MFS transporter [Xanthobacteraceae bacterium]